MIVPDVIQQFTSEGCLIEFYQKLLLCFQEQKPFVLKTVFLTLGLGMSEGVDEGSRCGDRCIAFSSISSRHSSRNIYVLPECLVFHFMST